VTRNTDKYKRLREKMVDSMWERFCRLADPSKIRRERFASTRTVDGKVAMLTNWLVTLPPGWYWESPLEQALMLQDENVSLKPCVPTRARPGTPEKIDVLAERVLKGYESHHPQDATYGSP